MDIKHTQPRKTWMKPAIVLIVNAVQSGAHHTFNEATLVPAPGGLLKTQNGAGGYVTPGLFSYVHS
ncbi:hypothetical protein ACFGVR_07350 [Mucilaginibacter sp. AW1-3]